MAKIEKFPRISRLIPFQFFSVFKALLLFKPLCYQITCSTARQMSVWNVMSSMFVFAISNCTTHLLKTGHFRDHLSRPKDGNHFWNSELSWSKTNHVKMQNGFSSSNIQAESDKFWHKTTSLISSSLERHFWRSFCRLHHHIDKKQ